MKKRTSWNKKYALWDEHPEYLEYLLKWYEHFGAKIVANDLGIEFEIVRAKSNTLKLRMLSAEERLCYKCRKNKCYVPNHGRNNSICHECLCEKRKNNRRREFKQNPLDSRLTELSRTIKLRSKKKGFETDVDKDYLYDLWHSQNGMCAYSGLEMTASAIVGDSRNPTAISVDRIDSSRGYTRDNIVLTCWKVNAAKSDLSLNEFVEMCKAITEKYNKTKNI